MAPIFILKPQPRGFPVPEEGFKRKLAAILSADVKEYSRLMREDEAATIRTLTAYREVMTSLIKQHHGRVVDTVGDNLLAEFASVVDAVQGAVAIQKEIKSRNAQLPKSRRMLFRIGINLGDLVVEDDRIYGDGVNIAARLEAIADPGGICISRTAYDQIEDKLPLGYEYLGEKTVKNTIKPIRAYRVLFEPGKETFRKYTFIHKRWTKPGETDKPSEDQIKETGTGFKIGDTSLFHKHLLIYAGVIGFLFIINLLTWGGVVWFHWPALGWGLFLFLQWINITKRKGAEEKDKSKIWLRKHVGMYLSVTGFLFIINMVTWSGSIWFHWPALGWGLLLFLHLIMVSKFLPKGKP
jgi:class 3 adenylate cyclase